MRQEVRNLIVGLLMDCSLAGAAVCFSLGMTYVPVPRVEERPSIVTTYLVSKSNTKNTVRGVFVYAETAEGELVEVGGRTY